MRDELTEIQKTLSLEFAAAEHQGALLALQGAPTVRQGLIEDLGSGLVAMTEKAR